MRAVTGLIGEASEAAEADRQDRRCRGRDGQPRPYDPKAGISASPLYDQLKRFFVECSQALEITDRPGAARIAQASTHWLRHTFGSHAVAAHAPLEVVQSARESQQRFWDEQMVARERRRAGVE